MALKAALVCAKLRSGALFLALVGVLLSAGRRRPPAMAIFIPAGGSLKVGRTRDEGCCAEFRLNVEGFSGHGDVHKVALSSKQLDKPFANAVLVPVVPKLRKQCRVKLDCFRVVVNDKDLDADDLASPARNFAIVGSDEPRRVQLIPVDPSLEVTTIDSSRSSSRRSEPAPVMQGINFLELYV